MCQFIKNALCLYKCIFVFVNANNVHTVVALRRWMHAHTFFEQPTAMGLLPDTQNCGLCMRLECRERFPRHWLKKHFLAIPACITARDHLPVLAGKTFPAFPAHAQPAILRIWQKAHGFHPYNVLFKTRENPCCLLWLTQRDACIVLYHLALSCMMHAELCINTDWLWYCVVGRGTYVQLQCIKYLVPYNNLGSRGYLGV